MNSFAARDLEVFGYEKYNGGDVNSYLQSYLNSTHFNVQCDKF